ncbi:MAG: YihY/virulence factor BrkB family protein [Candidatus Manganitrophus sp.]|nr:MAG: YihY/virulence factor BrkB family protein [Candidatus Manganitrophus sp.]
MCLSAECRSSFYGGSPVSSLSLLPCSTNRSAGVWTATLTGAILLELSKWLFGWYISVARGYTILYGTLSGFLFLCLWLYYVSLVFILSGVIGSSADRIATSDNLVK